MGFLGNMMNEFGTKTGKALGNKLYGKHADDYRIGYGENDYSRSKKSRRAEDDYDEEDYGEIVRAEQQVRDFEREDALLSDVLTMEFDYTDKDSLIKTLTKLMSYVDILLKENVGSKEKVAAVQSKFDLGLTMLQSVDPNNPMIVFFNNKKIEWHKRKTKNTKILLVILAVWLVFMFFVFAFAFGLF